MKNNNKGELIGIIEDFPDKQEIYINKDKTKFYYEKDCINEVTEEDMKLFTHYLQHPWNTAYFIIDKNPKKHYKDYVCQKVVDVYDGVSATIIEHGESKEEAKKACEEMVDNLLNKYIED